MESGPRLLIKGGSVFDGKGFHTQDVLIENATFSACTDSGQFAAKHDDIIIDARGLIVSAGFIDLHFHGCMGHDFCDGTSEAIDAISRFQASRGITSICPATMTYPEDKLTSIMGAAANWHAPDDGSALVGINMEGPFISASKVGAQNPLYVQIPDGAMLTRLIECSGGLVKLVDVAPEEDGAIALIESMRDIVRFSIAHTCADYDCTQAAFAAGARQMTHLFNAMPPLHHRCPGPIAAAMDRDDVSAEIIADGIHIHPAMVRLAFREFGSDRMILISDSMMATGLDDGEYSLGGLPVTVCANQATLHDGTLAGSATNLARCIQIAHCDMGIPANDVLRAATVNPARALGIDDTRGSIEAGKIADCVLLDSSLAVQQVILRGKLLTR